MAVMDELSHNQAILTLTVERRELLGCRTRIAELEQLARGQVVLLEQSRTSIEGLEAQLAEVKAATAQEEDAPAEESEQDE